MNLKINKIFSRLFFIIILLILLFNSFYIVKSEEHAVIERFGEKIKLVEDAGFKLKIPLFDKVRKVNTQKVHTLQYGYRSSDVNVNQTPKYSDVSGEAIILTKGSYLVNVEAMIQYRISDATNYLYNVDEQIETLRLAFESVLRRNVQNKDLDDALVNKDKISSEAFPELVRKINSYGLGIQIKTLKIQNISVPTQVKSAYDDVNNAKNEKSQLLDTAKKYKNEKLPNARAEAYKRIQEAEGYKAEKVSQAKGDVENFVQVYEKYIKAKEITKTRLYLETMEKILKKVDNKFIIDTNSDNIIKYLPLDPNSLNKSKGGE